MKPFACLGIALAGIVAVVALFCVSVTIFFAIVPIGRQASAASAPAVRTDAVTMRNDRFSPVHAEVSRGSAITWTNEDSQRHNVIFRGGGPADSPLIAKGETYRATFDQPGTFDYVCTLHPGMVGRVTVVE
jgi:plastocyanin